MNLTYGDDECADVERLGMAAMKGATSPGALRLGLKPSHPPLSPRPPCAAARATHTHADTAFVLVAGGLGERLGYSGIKVSLPVELSTGACYLQLYASYILNFQRLAGGDVKVGGVVLAPLGPGT